MSETTEANPEQVKASPAAKPKVEKPPAIEEYGVRQVVLVDVERVLELLHHREVRLVE